MPRRKKTSHSWLPRLLALIGAALVLVVLVTAGQVVLAIASFSSNPLGDSSRPEDKVNQAASSLRPNLATGAPVRPSVTPNVGLLNQEVVNFLLLGYGGVSHAGSYLTDTIMVVSLQPKTGEVQMLSIPRDLYVRLPDGGYSKINAAFGLGVNAKDRDEGMRTARITVEKTLDVRIDRTVAIDFSAFKQVVDLIGGVDIEVERSFTAQYPANDDDQIDAGWITVSFSQGLAHMDAQTALQYSRARYSDSVEGTDFARSVRQQKVMSAAARKIQSDKLLVLKGLTLLDALKDHLRTDLSLAEMQALAGVLTKWDDSKVTRASLNVENVLTDTLDPVAGAILFAKSDDLQIRAYAAKTLRFSRMLKETAHVDIVVDASDVDSANALVRLLNELGVEALVQTTLTPSMQLQVQGDLGAENTCNFIAWYVETNCSVVAQVGSGRVVINVPLHGLLAPLRTTSPRIDRALTPTAPSSAPARRSPPPTLTPSAPPLITPKATANITPPATATGAAPTLTPMPTLTPLPASAPAASPKPSPTPIR